mmetsp:Transcript_33195/g.69755  ORF Transcript_33195/g.69755 Transcript_33195/m.69755 type:complete len:272 (+) Transcript_33195:68-883(+)
MATHSATMLQSITASSPDPDDHNPAIIAIRSVERANDSIDSIADLIRLFSDNYDAANGRVGSVLWSGDKRPASPCRTSTKCASSPVKKRNNTMASPARSVSHAVTAIAATTLNPINISTPTMLTPSDLSPNLALDSLLMTDPPHPPQTKKKTNSKYAMIGHLPKSTFLTWLRKGQTSNADIGESQMKKEIAAWRNLILYHFSKKGNIRSKKGFVADDEEVERVTRSGTADENDEWMIDIDAATCNITDTHCLSHYHNHSLCIHLFCHQNGE